MWMMTIRWTSHHKSHRRGNRRGAVNDNITEFYHQHIEHTPSMRRWRTRSSLFGGRLTLTWPSCNVYSALKDHDISWIEYPVIFTSPGEPQLMRACQTRSWMPLRQSSSPPTIKMKPESGSYPTLRAGIRLPRPRDWWLYAEKYYPKMILDSAEI